MQASRAVHQHARIHRLLALNDATHEQYVATRRRRGCHFNAEADRLHARLVRIARLINRCK